MKKLLIVSAVTASLFASSVFADDGLFTPDPVEEWSYSFSYNFFTSHPSSDGYTDDETGEYVEWNEVNKVMGVRVNVNDNIGYFVGSGENSYYEDMLMGGVEFSTSTREMEIGSDVGLASGYDTLVSGGVLPFVNPFVRANAYFFNDALKASVKVGNVNFMAFNAHAELTFNF